jgi:hypothetical protein
MCLCLLPYAMELANEKHYLPYLVKTFLVTFLFFFYLSGNFNRDVLVKYQISGYINQTIWQDVRYINN